MGKYKVSFYIPLYITQPSTHMQTTNCQEYLGPAKAEENQRELFKSENRYIKKC